MGSANRFVGFAAGFASASLLYMAAVVVQLASHGPHDVRYDLLTFEFTVFFWLFNGLAAALALLALPWYAMVRFAARSRMCNPLYFALSGAASMLGIGCITSSLAPKPLFIEDQTFIEGVAIAFERQGVDLLLTGCVFGVTYWLVSERRRRPSSVDA